MAAQKPRLNFDYAVGGYLRNHVEVNVMMNTGKISVPVMGSPDYPATADTTESIQVCSPSGFKVIRFDLVRVGVKPRVPSPWANADTNLEFLGGEIRAAAPVILSDMVTVLWQCAGVYYYRLKRPEWTEEGIKVGNSTIDGGDPAGNVLEAKQFFPVFPNKTQQQQAAFGIVPKVT